VKHRYGTQAATVINNHRAKVLLSGLSDPESLEYMSRLIGESAEMEESRTTGDGRDSRSTRTAYRRLAPMSALRQVRPGEGVLVYGHLAPVRLRLRYWWKDRPLRGLARGAPSEEARIGRAGATAGASAGATAGREARVVELDEVRRGRRGA
jgi:type IV secretory pathway TraG/TraD family ATPase VirD4